MKTTFSTARIVIVTTVFLGLFAGRALAIGEPIPGIDIVVKKNPPGRMITAKTDKAGQFSVVVKEPGQYSVSIVRKAEKSTPEQLSITASGTTLKKTGPITYDFTVGREPVTLRGMVSENDSPKPTKRSARSGGVDDTLPDGPQRVATDSGSRAMGDVSTTRGKLGNPVAPDAPPSAPVNTSRSNKKTARGMAGVDDAAADGPQRVATEDTMGALAGVSTTRGRVEKPGVPDGDETSLLGILGDPIPGVGVGLEGDPEGARVGTTTTDHTGAFRFGKVPAGKYRLVIAGQPDRLLSVGADGVASGKVMRGEGGSLRIFDRWGKAVAASKAADKKRPAGAENGDVLPGAPVSTSRSNKKR